MFSADLNLLVALDVLLAERSVAKAAKRLRLSPSAMSRTLARLREATGDALLVRAGRGLVPTPRALALGQTVGGLVREGEAMLRPAEGLDLARLERTFTMRAREGFVENFGAELVSRVMAAAPKVRLHFIVKADKDSGPLRDGSIDLETGVVESVTGPEIRTQRLFDDRYVGVVRTGHPLAGAPVSAAAYAASAHVQVSLQGSERAPIDDGFATAGLRRTIVSEVSGFAAALALARGSDLVATVPERHTQALRGGMATFQLPLPLWRSAGASARRSSIIQTADGSSHRPGNCRNALGDCRSRTKGVRNRHESCPVRRPDSELGLATSCGGKTSLVDG